MSEHDHDGHRHGTEPEHRDEPEHWHPELRPHLETGVCESCGTNEHVHRGLCQRCRELQVGKGARVAPEHREHPHEAPSVPPRNPRSRRKRA